MIDRLDIRPSDRVLLLSIPDKRLVTVLADRLERGVLVGLGSPGKVAEARQATRERKNVMFQPGSAEEIPWQDHYFSKVIDVRGGWKSPEKAAREVRRVLAPGGKAYLAVNDGKPLADAGLTEAEPLGEIRVFHAASA